jgi:hypothetical protein
MSLFDIDVDASLVKDYLWGKAGDFWRGVIHLDRSLG